MSRNVNVRAFGAIFLFFVVLPQTIIGDLVGPNGERPTTRVPVEVPFTTLKLDGYLIGFVLGVGVILVITIAWKLLSAIRHKNVAK
jgi:hypothetical protein